MEWDRQELMNCLWCIKSGILPLWVNYWLKFRINRTRWIPSQMQDNFTILRQRAAPERPRGMLSRARYTECYGFFRKRFWKPTCSGRTTLCSLRKFTEFGIIFWRIDTWYCRKYNEAGVWNEKRNVEYVDTCTTLPKRSWNSTSHWRNLFSVWALKQYKVYQFCQM